MLSDERDILLDYVQRCYWGVHAKFMEDEEGSIFPTTASYYIAFFHWYNDIVSTVPFKRDDYDNHERLQELLDEFQLDKEKFWYLTLYLYDYITDCCKNLFAELPSGEDKLKEFGDFILENEIVSITVTAANKKKKTISGKALTDYITINFDFDKLSLKDKWSFYGRGLGTAQKEENRRKINYFFAKDMAAFLKLKGITPLKRRAKAAISNKEKELILCLLYICKFADNSENYLDLGYYNGLIKDYKGSTMNWSQKYETKYLVDWPLF